MLEISLEIACSDMESNFEMRYIDRKIYPILATNSNFAVNMRKYEN